MKDQHEITAILEEVQTAAGNELIIERDAVLAEYEKLNTSRSGSAIKVLTILGGFLATLAFILFLFLAGIDSELGLSITGALFVAGAIFLIKTYNILIFDAIAVTAFATGLFLMSYGLTRFMNDSMICIMLMIIGIITLAIVQNYLLAFLSVLTIHGAILALLVQNKIYNGLHFYIVAMLVLFTLFILHESGLVSRSKKLSNLYNPIRLGLLCSLLAGYVLIDFRDIFRFSIQLNLLPSIIAIIATLYLLAHLLKLLDIQHTGSKTGIYIATTIVLLPAVYAPAIPGALLIMLLCFRINYKIGVVMSIIALVYFISRYYYNLQFTLLTKSIILFASGVLFILFYLLTQKKLNQHEKI